MNINTKIKTVASMLIFLTGINGYAQKSQAISIPLSSPGKTGTLNVGLVRGSITVTAYDGKEVLVTVNGGEDNKEPQPAPDGLRKISSGGLEIEAEESNNQVEIHGNAVASLVSLEINVPKNFNLKLSTVNDGEILVKGVSGEMEISNVNGGIRLEGVSGSVSSNCVNGTIKADFVEVNPSNPLAFSTLNGDVDVTMPATFKATTKFKSDRGDVYTDFEIKMNPSQGKIEASKEDGVYKVNISNWVEGTINGGGPQILMKTMNGNLYLRKRK